MKIRLDKILNRFSEWHTNWENKNSVTQITVLNICLVLEKRLLIYKMNVKDVFHFKNFRTERDPVNKKYRQKLVEISFSRSTIKLVAQPGMSEVYPGIL